MRQRLKTILAVLYQRLPLWCYLAALALWLGLALADYIGDGLRAEAALNPADAVPPQHGQRRGRVVCDPKRRPPAGVCVP